MRRTVLFVAGATLVFAFFHSLLATNWMKDRVEARFGRRVRNGLYRFLYMQTTFLSVGALFWSFSRLPDRVVYRVPSPLSWLMRLGQLFALGLMVDANRRLGVARFSGMQGLWEFITGKEPQPEPPAQGPVLDDPQVKFRTGGAFRLSRHPNNLGPTLLVCLQPTMTVRWLTFAVVGSLYAFFGSLLEERRARAAYRAQYDAYRARTPYFFPIPLGRQAGPEAAKEVAEARR